MTIKELRIGAARTLNLGNYESLRIEALVVAEPGEGEDIGVVKQAMQAELMTILEETYRAQSRKRET